MKSLLTALLVFSFSFLLSAAEPTKVSVDPRMAAALDFLVVMKMDSMLNESMDKMLDLQIKSNQALTPYREVMHRFLAKYMSWESLKDEFARMYAAEFTEKELRDLIAFYQSPTGKKAVEKMPILMEKGGDIGVQRVQAHMDELNQMLQEEQQRQQNKK